MVSFPLPALTAYPHTFAAVIDPDSKDLIIALVPTLSTFLLGVLALIYSRRSGGGVRGIPGLPPEIAEQEEAVELARLVPPDDLVPFLMSERTKDAERIKAIDREKDYYRDWARDHVARFHPEMPMPPEYRASTEES